jgi:hypothetical protein
VKRSLRSLLTSIGSHVSTFCDGRSSRLVWFCYFDASMIDVYACGASIAVVGIEGVAEELRLFDA